MATEEENLKNADATPKQHEIFARIHADSDTNLTNQNISVISLFGSPNSATNDTKKVNKFCKIIAEDLIPLATQVVLDRTIPAGFSFWI